MTSVPPPPRPPFPQSVEVVLGLLDPDASIDPAAAQLVTRYLEAFAARALAFANRRAELSDAKRVTLADLRAYVLGVAGLDVPGFYIDELGEPRPEMDQLNKVHLARVEARNLAIASQNVLSRNEKRKRKRFVE
jgi:hypothetical protein